MRLKNGTYYRKDHPLVTDGSETHMEVSVSYALGGTNWFNGKQERRGIYAHFSPVEVVEHGEYSSRVMKLGGNNSRKVFMKELKRKSDKSGNECADKLLAIEAAVVEAAVNYDWPRIHTLLSA